MLKSNNNNDRSGGDKPAGKSGAEGADRLSLEDIVHLANKIGLEMATARKDAEKLELLKPTVRARIMMRLESGGTLSEARLRRLTEVDEEYVSYLERMAEARGTAEQLRIRYESYKNLFEARRSLLSYQKAEMKLI